MNYEIQKKHWIFSPWYSLNIKNKLLIKFWIGTKAGRSHHEFGHDLHLTQRCDAYRFSKGSSGFFAVVSLLHWSPVSSVPGSQCSSVINSIESLQPFGESYTIAPQNSAEWGKEIKSQNKARLIHTHTHGVLPWIHVYTPVSDVVSLFFNSSVTWFPVLIRRPLVSHPK